MVTWLVVSGGFTAQNQVTNQTTSSIYTTSPMIYTPPPIIKDVKGSVRPYPHYYENKFNISGNAPDLHLEVSFDCQGLSKTVDAQFTYMVFKGNVSVLDMLHDPANATVQSEMTARGLELEYKSSTNLAQVTKFDEVMPFAVGAGKYAWVSYIEASQGETVGSLTVTVSLVSGR